MNTRKSTYYLAALALAALLSGSTVTAQGTTDTTGMNTTMPPATTGTLDQTAAPITDTTDDADDGTDWGWIGLLGLAGLAGLRRPKTEVHHTSTTPGAGYDTNRRT